MEYMLIFFETAEEQARADQPETAGAYWGAWTAYVDAIRASGLMRGGNGLQPPRTATSVRVVGGQRQVQDGPYAETREHLGGYFIIDAPSMEVALEWAARAPNAAAGHTEVRPVLPPMPPDARQPGVLRPGS